MWINQLLIHNVFPLVTNGLHFHLLHFLHFIDPSSSKVNFGQFKWALIMSDFVSKTFKQQKAQAQ